jgi:hypothetical protein
MKVAEREREEIGVGVSGGEGRGWREEGGFDG